MLFEFFTFVNVETHFTQLTPWVQVEKGIRDASILFYACNVVTVESNYTTFKEILISWLRWGLRHPPGPKCPLFVTICSPLPLFHFQRPNVLFIVNHVDPHVHRRKAFYLFFLDKFQIWIFNVVNSKNVSKSKCWINVRTLLEYVHIGLTKYCISLKISVLQMKGTYMNLRTESCFWSWVLLEIFSDIFLRRSCWSIIDHWSY